MYSPVLHRDVLMRHQALVAIVTPLPPVMWCTLVELQRCSLLEGKLAARPAHIVEPRHRLHRLALCRRERGWTCQSTLFLPELDQSHDSREKVFSKNSHRGEMGGVLEKGGREGWCLHGCCCRSNPSPLGLEGLWVVVWRSGGSRIPSSLVWVSVPPSGSASSSAPGSLNGLSLREERWDRGVNMPSIHQRNKRGGGGVHAQMETRLVITAWGHFNTYRTHLALISCWSACYCTDSKQNIWSSYLMKVKAAHMKWPLAVRWSTGDYMLQANMLTVDRRQCGDV